MEIIVVGCGVSGLTCGVRLLEKGFKVTLLARELPGDTTSDTAAAVWYPYRVGLQERVRTWARVSFNEFCRLSSTVPASRVSMVEFVHLFHQEQLDPEWKSIVPRFEATFPSELRELGYQYGYTIEVPLIEASAYLTYLKERFEGGGGKVEQREVRTLDELHQDHRLIVNCSGVWARNLVDDKTVQPGRGQILRVGKVPGISRCIIDETPNLTYIVPREGDCILGGTDELVTTESETWSTDPDPQTSEDILGRCMKLEPSLRDAEVLECKVGLRPERRAGVRLELERVVHLTRCGIIHNYGHGGAGFTLSWGCATEVAEIAVAFREGSV